MKINELQSSFVKIDDILKKKHTNKKFRQIKVWHQFKICMGLSYIYLSYFKIIIKKVIWFLFFLRASQQITEPRNSWACNSYFGMNNF